MLTNSWNWALLEKSPIVQLLKKFPTFYWTRKFTRALHWSPSWARSIQSISFHPIPLRSILILSPTYVLVFPVVSFLLAFPPISYMHSSSPHSCCLPCQSHPSWYNHSNYTWRRLQVTKLLIMQFSPTSRHFIYLRSKYSPQHQWKLLRYYLIIIQG
jgi:hypothetical protein